MNPNHIARRFEGKGNIFKNFLRDVAVSGNNKYLCRAFLKLAIVEDGMNKFIGWSLCNG
ncbi:MAG: hypothetical protein MJZ90_02215 [Bacteroidales bacterium]|nr:hypothetical protein [Bacteroidales bacterium]